MLDRSETVRRIEQLGVVAVIRLRDPAKLRAVVDAIAAGGVRALEVTMTVPGPCFDSRASPTRPRVFAGRGNGPRRGDGTRRHRRRGAVRISPLPRAVIDASMHVVCRLRPAVHTTSFSTRTKPAPTRQGLSGDRSRAQYIKDSARPCPAELCRRRRLPDNAGDWIRAGAVAVAAGSSLLDAAAIESGRFEVITANARRIVENVAAARGGR